MSRFSTFRLLLCVSLDVLVFQATAVVHAKEETLKVAIVASPEVDQLGLTDLVTVEMSTVPNITLVDRSNIDLLSKELNFAAFCKPASVKQRQVLGKMLGADLLVVVRARGHENSKSAAAKVRQIHLIVVDCRYAARLVDQLLPFENEKSATTIRDLVVKTCQKYADGVRHIVGIMPVVSTDAYGQITSLDEGLPCLVGRLLIHEANFVILETEECLAIEQERQLGTIPNTSVPITILKGSYAVQVVPDSKPNIELSFEVNRHGKTITRSKFTLPKIDLQNPQLSTDSINQILGFLQKALHASKELHYTQAGLDATIDTLLQQVELQTNLGAWESMCHLAEAILLIKPNCAKARLYAIGGYHRRCQHLPRIREQRKLLANTARLLHRLLHRWLDHVEYLIRNNQISVAQASMLYSTLEFNCSKSRVIRHGRKSFYVGELPKTDPLAISCQKLTEYYVQSVLPMMRERVKHLPTQNDPSLAEVFNYCIAPTDDRAEMVTREFFVKNRADRRAAAPHAVKYWPPDSRQSQIVCWKICSLFLMPSIHEAMQQCYANQRERYLATAHDLLAFEEECIREPCPENITPILARRYFFRTDFGTEFEKRNPMMYVPEMVESYEAMFDRLQQDKDPNVKLCGMIGKLALRRREGPTISQLRRDQITGEEMEHVRETIRRLEKIREYAEKFGQKKSEKRMDFNWITPELSLLFESNKGIDTYCQWELQALEKLAKEASVVTSDTKVVDKKAFRQAKMKLDDLAQRSKLKHITVPVELAKPDPLTVPGTPVRPETHLALGRTCAWYSLIPNVNPKPWRSLLKLDSETDLIVTQNMLMHMKKPGRFEKIFVLARPKNVKNPKNDLFREKPSYLGNITNVLYDGTYLWVVSTHGGIYVLKLDGQLVGSIYDVPGFQFSSVERLVNDQFTPLLSATIESPGKLLVVMRTKKASIIGRIQVDHSKQLTFEPLHLASKTPIKQSVEAFMPPDTPFDPEPWIHLFKYNDKQQWLAVPRTMSYTSHQTYSTLWVNIKDPTEVRVDTQQLKRFPMARSWNRRYCFDFPSLSLPGNQAAGFQYGHHRFSDKRPLNLCVVTPPKLEEIGTTPASFRRLADPEEKGDLNCGKPNFVTQDDEHFFVAYPGKKFAKINKRTLKVECYPLLGDTEGTYGLYHFVSTCYGIVAFDQERLYKLHLDDKGPKLSGYFNKVPAEHFSRHTQAMERLVQANAYVVPWADPMKRYSYNRFEGGYLEEKGGGCYLRIDDKTSDIKEVCRALPDVYSIKTLVLDGAKLTEKDFESLASCDIDKLVLNFPPDSNGTSPLTDKALAMILRNEKLKHLYIKDNRLTDKAFEGIENAKSLHTLELFSDRFSGRAFSHIAKAPSLKRLEFQGPHFDDQSLLALCEACNWIELFFERTKITPTGLAKLYSKWNQNRNKTR